MICRSDFLKARDGRQQELDRILGQARPEDAASFLLISANVPGCDKLRPGISRLLRGALDSLHETVGLKVLFTRRDLLGPFYIASSNLPPLDAKRAALVIEAETPAARLLDVDVYRPDGFPGGPGWAWTSAAIAAWYVPSPRASASCCGAIPTRNSWNEWIRCCGLS